MSGVTSGRWQEAQEAERGFWSPAAFGLGKFRRAATGSIATAEWVLPQLDVPAGDWLEVGIGPLGVGCMHFLGCPGELHTLDPLEPTPLESLQLPEPCVSLVRACREASTRHVGQAEKLEFADGSFTFVAMENMLDHVQDPAAVLAEARRVLGPGGMLYVAVDTFSLLGELRFKLIARRRWRDTMFVRAHPHRFSGGEVLRLVADAGFETVRADAPGPVETVIGRHFRTRLVAR
ncbi:MAG TPA: methyltransferase domain-containing protein [Solirubrobacteraceae bacterium]